MVGISWTGFLTKNKADGSLVIEIVMEIGRSSYENCDVDVSSDRKLTRNMRTMDDDTS